jgi:competence protein ComEC
MVLSQWVVYTVSAFGAGIFFASFFFSSGLLAILTLLIGITLISLFWRKWKVVLVGMMFLAVGFGTASYVRGTALPEPIGTAREVSFEGRIVGVPEKDEQGIEAVVTSLAFDGKALLFLSPFAKVQEGDYVLVSGDLQSPKSFEGFNYPLYLAKEGVSWILFYPHLEVQSSGTSVFSSLRETLQERIDRALPSPESSVLAAMLLGNKAGLPEEFKEDLNNTGTRHITAISGMHVAILSGMLLAFLLNVGVPKKKSSLIVLLFLVFFVLFTGMQTSALRAGIMGSSFLIAGLFGRMNISLRTLLFAATGLLLFNPLLLAHDIGFQLSFLAVFGILLFLPLLQYFFRTVPNPFGVRDIFFMSIAAQVFTLPLVLYHFGTLSFVSLVTNLLIVPILSLVLLLGTLFLFLSLFFPFVSALLALPVGLLLSYVSFIVTTFSDLPFAAKNVEAFPLWVLLPLLIPLSFIAFRFRQQQRFRFQDQTMIV